MKKTSIVTGLLFILYLVSSCLADINYSQTVGVGSRSFGMANNFVALSNDQSALFWNPAGLGFVPAREFQFSIDGVSLKNNSAFDGSSTTENNSSVIQRLRLANIGYLHAFPTTQGGISIAVAYQTPFQFDNLRDFSGSYMDTKNNFYNVNHDYRSYGDVGFWTAGFGLQIAEGLSIGAAISYVYGDKNIHDVFYIDSTNSNDPAAVKNSVVEDYNDTYTESYSGYDIRFGFLYVVNEHFNIGARLVLPQTIGFTSDNPATGDGSIFSSYSGAVGISGTFPLMAVSTEFRARAPYTFAYPNENIPLSSLASKTIYGAGLGIEMPIIKSKTLLRAGYSWDQYDTHLFTMKYDYENNINWDPQGLTPTGNKQLITLGLAFIFKSTCWEISYGHSMWKLETNGTLSESITQDRLTTSLSFRF